MNLFEVGKEYELRKTIRILVYPNITFLKDLEKDSYIQVIKKQLKRDYIFLNIQRNCCNFIIISGLILMLGYVGKILLWNDNSLYKNNLVGHNSSLVRNFPSFACHIDIGLIIFSLVFLIYKCSTLIEDNCFNHLNVRYDDSDFHLIRA